MRSLHHRPRLAGCVGCLLVFVLAAPGWAGTPNARAAELLERLTGQNPQPDLGGTAVGISVAVAAGGEVVFSQGGGYAELEHQVPASSTTVFNIGSISKVITTVAVLQLVEAGKLSLDDPIQAYVPAFPDKGSPITVWHVLTHTSGIRHYLADEFPDSPSGDNVMPFSSFDDAVGLFKDDPLLFEPGAYYKYSSYAVNLLQGVIESSSGKSFEEYLREHVWQPAGMSRTGFDVPARIVPGRARGYTVRNGERVHYPYLDPTYKLAGGGMISTAEDLVRFALALTRGALLKPETVEAMFTVQLEEIEAFDDGEPLRWEQALMWRIRRDEEDRPYVHHCGTIAGTNACLIIYEDEELIAAVVDNAAVTGLATARAFADIFRKTP